MPHLITPHELEEFLAQHSEWKWQAEAIERTLKFTDFTEAMTFVNEVAELAEEANHHPDIDIRWNTVRLVLVTHSAGGLTTQDLEMASRLDRLI